MSFADFHKPPHPDNDVPERFEPGVPPVEPDEGPGPVQVPNDPEPPASAALLRTTPWRPVPPIAPSR